MELLIVFLPRSLALFALVCSHVPSFYFFIQFLVSVLCERSRPIFGFPNPDYNTFAELLDRGSCKALVDFDLIVLIFYSLLFCMGVKLGR